MKANELRIGNFVSKDGEIYEADFITIRMTENYEPIPITEEWLLKFGFDKVLPRNDKMYYRLNDYFVIEDSRVFLLGDDAFEILKLRQEIKYVHQLQNLYFALTGEELTIKE